MSDNELLDIAFNSDVTPEAMEMVRNLLRQEEALKQYGIDPEEAKPRESVIMNVLDKLQTGQRAVEGVIDSALFRKDIGDLGIIGAAKRGIDEKVSGANILGQKEWFAQHPIAKAALGFGLDVALDPLNLISFGAGKGARAGGRVLSKAGEAVSQAAERAMVKQQTLLPAVLGQALPEAASANGVEIMAKTQDAFSAMRSWSDELKHFKWAKKRGFTDGMADAAKKMESYRDTFQPYLDLAKSEGVDIGDLHKMTEDIPKLFKGVGIRVGANVPFLGHILGDGKKVAEVKLASELINPITQPNILKKAFSATAEAVGKVTKPGEVKLLEFDVPEPVLEVIISAGAKASDIMRGAITRVGQVAETLDKIPVLGTPLRKSANAVKGTLEFSQMLAKGLQSAFARTFYEGRHNREATLRLEDFRHGSLLNAMRESQELFKQLGDDPELFKRAATKLDALVNDPLREIIKDKELDTSVMKRLNDIFDGGEAVDSVHVAFTGENAEKQFTTALEAFLQNPAGEEELVPVVKAMADFHNKLRAEELAAGVNVGFVDAYLTHRYLNARANPKNFTSTRKYATLAQALESGLVGRTDPRELLAIRKDLSTRAIANKNFFVDWTLRNGTGINTWKRIAMDAIANPGGVEEQWLRRKGMRVPGNVTEEELENALMISGMDQHTRRQTVAAFQKQAKDHEEAVIGMLSGGPSPLPQNMVDEITSGVHDFTTDLNLKMEAKGLSRRDLNMPQYLARQVAKEVVDHNGKQYVLPIDVARAMEENMAARDIVKTAFGKSELGKKLLNMVDAGTNMYKRWLTMPWVANWANNLLGSASFSSPASLDPGNIARSLNLLMGKSALRVKHSGAMLAPGDIMKFLKDRGYPYSAGEMIDLIDAHGALNFDRIEAMQNGIFKNATTKDKFGLALQQAHSKIEFGYDGFFRFNEFVHRVSQGDTLDDALRYANEQLLNYRNMSPSEKSIFRRTYMFYGWLSKSTKRALTSLVTNPGEITNQLKAARAIAEAYRDPNSVPTLEDLDNQLLRSSTMAEQLSFNIGKLNGKTMSVRGFGLPITTPLQSFSLQMPRNFSVGELADAAGDSTVRTLQKQVAASNPFINAAMQKLSGKNLYFDKPLDAKFLRRLPSLEEAAKRLAPYGYDKIPVEIGKQLDAWTMRFLDATPDGQGRLIADPGKFFLLTLIPGLSRAINSVNTIANKNVPTNVGMLPLLSGVRVEEGDPERSLLATYGANLQQLMSDRNYDLRKEQGLVDPLY